MCVCVHAGFGIVVIVEFLSASKCLFGGPKSTSGHVSQGRLHVRSLNAVHISPMLGAQP